MFGIGAMFNYFGSKIRNFFGGFKKKDPVGQLKARIEKAKDEIRAGMGSLETVRGRVSTLQRQYDSASTQCDQLDRNVKAFIAKDEAKARSYIGQLQIKQKERDGYKLQLDQFNNTYKATCANITLNKDKILQAQAQAESLGAQLEASKINAEVAEMTAGMNDIGGNSLTDIGDLTNEIQTQIDKNNAKGQVQHDLGIDGGAQLEEQKLLLDAGTDDLLNQYKISAGLIQPATEPVAKTIGPSSEVAA